MECPNYQSEQIVKNGKAILKDNSQRQRYLCRTCGKRFNELTNTPLSRLRTPPELVSTAMNVRSEGLGIRATGRCLGKSHSTIIRWEKRFAAQLEKWSPPAPENSAVTVEGDEVYTRVRKNISPQ